jgi:hypothetical protein
VAKRRGQRDFQDSLGLQPASGRLGFGFFDFGKDPHARFVVARAFIGQRYAPRGSIQQPDAQPCFERRQLSTDRRGRYPQFARSRRKACRAYCFYEHSHFIKRTHLCVFRNSIFMKARLYPAA